MKEKKNILIIDDHDSIRQLLGLMLSKNYEVVIKSDGFEGMVYLGGGNIPDLILLDIGMPRMDGFSFIKNLKSSYFLGDIPIVVISGNEDSRDKQYCLEMGVSEFFPKPFNPLDLKDKIHSILAA